MKFQDKEFQTFRYDLVGAAVLGIGSLYGTVFTPHLSQKALSIIGDFVSGGYLYYFGIKNNDPVDFLLQSYNKIFHRESEKV